MAMLIGVVSLVVLMSEMGETFHLPGMAPQEFSEGDAVNMKVRTGEVEGGVE